MPRAEKLVMPPGYGETTTTQYWPDVRARLTVAKQYWVATNRRDGSPHVVPVDGLWVDDVNVAAARRAACERENDHR